MSNKFAVFDIDGTLYRGTFFISCVEAFIEKGLVSNADHDKLALYKKAWQEREHAESYSHFVNYLVDTWDECIKHIPIGIFESVAAELAEQGKSRVYCYTRDLAKRLKSEEYTLVAISGSFHEAVEPFAKHYGFDIIAGEENIRDGDKLTGQISQVTYTDKHLVLEKLIKQHGLTLEGSYAVGDTSGDSSMLAMVDNPIAFNPNQALHDEAVKNGWKIVVERKNVVYELAPNGDNRYVLQAA